MKKIKLVEGIDYTKEDGRIVFTREFLLKQGYCCNSKCKNCPYKEEKSQKIEDN